MARTPKWDREIVKLAARVKFVRAEQVARRFGMTVRNANMRLKLLTDAGLLRAETAMRGGWLYAATKDGIAFTGFDLSPARFSLSTITHDLAIADFVIDCERQGYRCLAEREITAYERAFDDRRYEFKFMRRGWWVRHRPDATIELPSGEFIAVEIELTMKSAERVREVLRTYQFRQGVDGFIGVVYLVGGDYSVPPMRWLIEQVETAFHSFGAGQFEPLVIEGPSGCTSRSSAVRTAEVEAIFN